MTAGNVFQWVFLAWFLCCFVLIPVWMGYAYYVSESNPPPTVAKVSRFALPTSAVVIFLLWLVFAAPHCSSL